MFLNILNQKYNYKFLSEVIFMILCLLPFSFSFGSGDGLSGNYLYILLPFIYFYINKKIYFLKTSFFIFLFFYFFIFLFALLYQFNFYEYFTRRSISFLLFISIFSFTLIEIERSTIKSFQIAVVLTSLFFSIKSIVLFFLLGGSNLGYEAKDLVGGQRYGFVILLAFWIINFQNTRFKPFKILIQLTLFIGLILTFSRASIVSFIASFIVYTFLSAYKLKNSNILNFIFKILLLNFTIIVIIVLTNLFFPQISDFFYDRLFSFFGNDGVEKMDLDNINGSEGYRIFMFKKIINFVFDNPLTGSGFLGVWILFDDKSGSSHSQYTDVFFRTGFLGFLIYLYILYKISTLLYYKYFYFFTGFISILIYGLFHETFKESHGAFILTFFIGLLASNNKKKEIFTGI